MGAKRPRRSLRGFTDPIGAWHQKEIDERVANLAEHRKPQLVEAPPVEIDIPVVEVPTEPVMVRHSHDHASPKSFCGTCRTIGKSGSLTPRKWVVRRATHNRMSEPIELFFSTSGGGKSDTYELQPDEAREMAKALMSYAEWLEPTSGVSDADFEMLDAEPAAKPARTKEEVDELREWAKTMDVERLAKHLRAAEYNKNVGTPLTDFLSGKAGSYHLHDALRQVREDAAGYD